jgi:hypothetical protein
LTPRPELENNQDPKWTFDESDTREIRF